MLYLIFHFKVNGAVNDFYFPAVVGCSSAASALESARGPLRSTAVNGSYFHPVTVKRGRDRMTISWPSDPVKAKSNCILTDEMMRVCLS